MPLAVEFGKKRNTIGFDINSSRIDELKKGKDFTFEISDEELKDDENAVNKMLEKEVALEKLGSPLEIANLVLFLSSSLSSNITGQIYVNDGGQIRG